MSNEKTQTQTKVVTGKVRFSYANVWEAKQRTDPKTGQPVGKPKFSVVLLIPKKDKTGINRLQLAINVAKELGKSTKWKGKIPANLDLPLRDGDEKFAADEDKYGAYQGMMYISAKSDTKPGILDISGNQIIERDLFYSGCWGKASINFFPYDNVSNGVAAGLNNLLKMEDDTNLGGGKAAAEDDFAADLQNMDEDL